MYLGLACSSFAAAEIPSYCAASSIPGYNQSINLHFLSFGTHQGSQQTITGKTTYTKH